MKLATRVITVFGYINDKRRNRRRERQEAKRRAFDGLPTLSKYSLERARNHKR
ncbi:hypothetical protein PEC301619_13010 [Pectobacterium carotovorum subsp. carotovorum]|nr:hypothetical protein PEC301619_13010 [Pectobacterium carotovorum subsp. carotovorum]